MLDIRRPTRHVVATAIILLALIASALADTPAMTTISDTVYRADGTPAAGTLLISWPAFTTGAGIPVAAGSKSVTIGTGGAVSVALVPNSAATPAGTLYSVVYRLSDGAVDCLNASVWAKK
jgi:ABC-type taurine transport system substrate-binding protein